MKKSQLRKLIRESIKELIEQNGDPNHNTGEGPCSGYGQSWVMPGDLMWETCLSCFQHGDQGAPNAQFPNGWNWTAVVGQDCECCKKIRKPLPDEPALSADIPNLQVDNPVDPIPPSKPNPGDNHKRF